MEVLVILCAATTFLWLYNANKLREQKNFSEFLKADNMIHRVVVSRAMRQLNDSNQYLETMTEEVDHEEEGCSDVLEVRKRVKASLISDNKIVITVINNLNEEDKECV